GGDVGSSGSPPGVMRAQLHPAAAASGVGGGSDMLAALSHQHQRQQQDHHQQQHQHRTHQREFHPDDSRCSPTDDIGAGRGGGGSSGGGGGDSWRASAQPRSPSLHPSSLLGKGARDAAAAGVPVAVPGGRGGIGAPGVPMGVLGGDVLGGGRPRQLPRLMVSVHSAQKGSNRRRTPSPTLPSSSAIGGGGGGGGGSGGGGGGRPSSVGGSPNTRSPSARPSTSSGSPRQPGRGGSTPGSVGSADGMSPMSQHHQLQQHQRPGAAMSLPAAHAHALGFSVMAEMDRRRVAEAGYEGGGDRSGLDSRGLDRVAAGGGPGGYVFGQPPRGGHESSSAGG
ncbi:unnamed protein product, partial [Sphacelaria rigidula]